MELQRCFAFAISTQRSQIVWSIGYGGKELYSTKSKKGITGPGSMLKEKVGNA